MTGMSLKTRAFALLDRGMERERHDEATFKKVAGVKTPFEEECWEHAKLVVKGSSFIDDSWDQVGSIYHTIVQLPDVLPGGEGDGTDRHELDMDDLMTGVGTELEHTGSLAVASDIAVDHLTEDADYYDHPEEPEGTLKSRLVSAYQKGGTWKACPGYPGYSVSSSGQIRNDSTGRVLAKPKNHDGYAVVTLMKNGTKHSAYVHDLVARAFHGSKPKGQDVRHKDTDKDDNTAANTAYGTRSQNMRDTYPNGHKRKK